MEQNEVYLIDVVRIFTRQWRSFAAVSLAVLVLTFAFCLLVPRQWESTAWIQIGQVGSVPAGQDQKVEPLQRVIERLQMVPFQNEVLKAAGFERDAAESRLYRNSLKVEPLPYANLIRIRVRANSRELAEKLAAATVEGLKGAHEDIEKNLLNMAQASLEGIESDLQNAKAERDLLHQAATSGGREEVSGKNVSTPALANLMLAGKDSEIRGLQHAKNDMLVRLSSTYTYVTSMPWPVYVPEKQAFPNFALTWGVGILAAILVGAFAAASRDVAQRNAAAARADAPP